MGNATIFAREWGGWATNGKSDLLTLASLAQAKLSDVREPTGRYRQPAGTHSWEYTVCYHQLTSRLINERLWTHH